MSKNLLQLLLITSLIISIAMVQTTTAEPTTTMSVEPWSFIDSELTPPSTITIDIKVTDVSDCMGYDFKLGYDTTILDAETCVVGDFLPEADRIVWTNTINEGEGYVWLVVTIEFADPVSGSGTLATITFTVTEIGSTPLDLYETMLTDSNAVEIPHEALDGYFTNTYLDQPRLWINTHQAKVWPEWSHGTAGDVQTIYARISNTGGMGCYVKVLFILWPTPIGPIEFESNTAYVEPDDRATVSASFAMNYPPGWYYVKASVCFSFDGVRFSDFVDYQPYFGGEGISRDTAAKFRIT